MTDVTQTVRDYSEVMNGGQLLVCLCSVKKEEIYKLENTTLEASKSQLRRFILLREQIISNFNPDYIIIDTSPGIRYWSINALAVADALFLTLKVGDIDIDGTNRLAAKIYSSLKKYGTRSFLLLNRVAGYCVPNVAIASTHHHGEGGHDVADAISGKTGMEVISAIPCYCDIQFSQKEFLTALAQPDHPFAKQVEKLIEAVQIKV
jgi:chromosome partitioning protein